MEVTLHIDRPRFSDFAVRGTTATQLIAALNARPFWGRYLENVSWRRTDRGREVAEVRILAKPTIELPRWREAARAAPDLRKAWETCLEEIKRHELGHHDDCRRTLREMRDRLGRSASTDKRAIQREIADLERILSRRAGQWHSGRGHPARAHRILRRLA